MLHSLCVKAQVHCNYLSHVTNVGRAALPAWELLACSSVCIMLHSSTHTHTHTPIPTLNVHAVQHPNFPCLLKKILYCSPLCTSLCSLHPKGFTTIWKINSGNNTMPVKLVFDEKTSVTSMERVQSLHWLQHWSSASMLHLSETKFLLYLDPNSSLKICLAIKHFSSLIRVILMTKIHIRGEKP